MQSSSMATSNPNPNSSSSTIPSSLGAIASAELASKFMRRLQERRTEEALQVLELLKARGVLPSRECVSRLVMQLCNGRSLSFLLQAQKIVWDLEKIRRTDLLDHSALSSLSVAYAESRMASYACSTVALMIRMGLFPSVNVWGSILSSVGNAPDKAPLALNLFCEICKFYLGSDLSEGSAEIAKFELILGKYEQSRFPNNVQVMMGLVGRDFDPRSFSEQKRVAFLSMKPDTGAFNAALSICANLGFVDQAQRFFQLMPLLGIRADLAVFDTLAKLYAKAGRLDLLREIPGLMREAGVEPTMSVVRSIVAGIVAAGHLSEAETIVLSMGVSHDGLNHNGNVITKENGETGSEDLKEVSKWGWLQSVKPDVGIHIDLMKALIRNGQVLDASRFLIDLTRSQFREDPDTLGQLVWGLVSLGLMEETHAILQHIASQGVHLGIAAYNSLLQGYCSTGQLSKAVLIISEIKENSIVPNELSYTPLIAAYLRFGDTEPAFELLREMISKGIPVSGPAYEPLLQVYASERKASSMLKVLEELCACPDVKVDISIWNMVVESLSRKNMMFQARKTIKKMVQSGVQPTGKTYFHLVKGYFTNNKVADLLSLWPEVKLASEDKGEVQGIRMEKEMLDYFLMTFVKGAYFGRALDVITYMDMNQIPLDKDAYKNMFLQLHSRRFTSKHKSQGRIDRRAKQLQEMESFKACLGLPHSKPMKKKR